jgi:hypothetical protein
VPLSFDITTKSVMLPRPVGAGQTVWGRPGRRSEEPPAGNAQTRGGSATDVATAAAAIKRLTGAAVFGLLQLDIARVVRR